MYTVLRFELGSNNLPTMDRYGCLLNGLVAGLYAGPDHEAARFSCSLSELSDPVLHFEEVCSTLEKIGPVLETAGAESVALSLDSAIEPEDTVDHYVSMSFPRRMIDLVVKWNIELGITVYGLA